MDVVIPTADRAAATGVQETLKCAIDVDTFSASPTEQFDLFRSWHEGVSEAQPIQENFQTFPAHEMVWDLGTIAALRLEVLGASKRYRWCHLKRAMVDNWFLFLPFSKDRNSGEKRKAGKLIMGSLAEPFEYVAEEDAYVGLIIPRSLPFIQSCRIEIRDESSRFLADFMLLLDRSLPDLRVADVPHVTAATANLFAACLTLSRDHIVEAQNAIDAVIADRASKIIAQKLNDPDLTPDRLCRELGVSRSRLYRIFEVLGGVSNYIRRKRLLKTRDILADRSDGRPISIIAEEWGFMDPSTYSRMFRKEFGITPREARAEGSRHRSPALLQQSSPSHTEVHTLGNLLLQHSFAL